MDRITYQQVPKEKSVRVYLGRNRVGTIKWSESGFYYQPWDCVGAFAGEKFGSIKQVMRSIEQS